MLPFHDYLFGLTDIETFLQNVPNGVSTVQIILRSTAFPHPSLARGSNRKLRLNLALPTRANSSQIQETAQVTPSEVQARSAALRAPRL